MVKVRSLAVVASLWTVLGLVGCADEGIYCVNGVCYYGYYYDSLVSGVTYRSQSSESGPVQTGVTGEGNDPGRFRYQVGDSVTLSLGDTVLGQSPALTGTSARVTPFDLAGVAEQAVGGCAVDGALPEDEFRIVHNLAVLLQTFDTDGNPSNGIDISSEVAALFEGRSIEVDQAWDDFQVDTDLQAVLDEANGEQLFPDARELRTREEALRALYEGIGRCEGNGGTGGAGGTGGTGGTGGEGSADCSDVTPGNGEFGAPCRNDGDCSGGLPCCTSTEVSEACGTTVDLCTCI